MSTPALDVALLLFGAGFALGLGVGLGLLLIVYKELRETREAREVGR